MIILVNLSSIDAIVYFPNRQFNLAFIQYNFPYLMQNLSPEINEIHLPQILDLRA